MIVTVKNKTPLVVPTAARRKAGFKSGQELEVKASGGVITIIPKPSPDEAQDEREVRDPRIQAAIRVRFRARAAKNSSMGRVLPARNSS
jgi:bifunctional DNA-binding transcriptional regulator/antitoxin component of YhaV-PrlF toxin-antitoxin module